MHSTSHRAAAHLPPVSAAIAESTSDTARGSSTNGQKTYPTAKAASTSKGLPEWSHELAPLPFRLQAPPLDWILDLVGPLATSTMGRALTARELELARAMFGNSLDLTQVRVVLLEHLPLAPLYAWLLRGRPARAFGNLIIYTSAESWVDHAWNQDEATSGWTENLSGKSVDYLYDPFDIVLAESRFLHELTHVWQHQHGLSTQLGHLFAVLVSLAGPDLYAIETSSWHADFDGWTDLGFEQLATVVQRYHWRHRRWALSGEPPAGQFPDQRVKQLLTAMRQLPPVDPIQIQVDLEQGGSDRSYATPLGLTPPEWEEAPWYQQMSNQHGWDRGVATWFNLTIYF